MPPEKERLLRYFRAAVAAADPAGLVSSARRFEGNSLVLSAPGVRATASPGSARRIFLAGGGKAGRAMGEAALAALGDRVSSGAIAVPRGMGGAAGPVRFVEAGHPCPDDGSRAAAREIRALLRGLREDDLVIAPLSGGGSAMISAPAGGITAGEKAEASGLLLSAGADIASLNTVRKHLSAVKGGLLARAARPALVWALLLSDVPGDDPSVIASGPFSPDPTTFADAAAALARHGVRDTVPAAVRQHLAAGAAGKVPETPKPGDPAFERVTCAIVGSNRTAMDAAAKAAEAEGAEVALLPGFLLGEARECARAFCARLREAAASLAPGRVAVLVAGGETTVRVRGGGTGGRSQEFALAAAMEIAGREGTAVLAAGTDGADGPTEAAGAFADGTSCARSAALGLPPGAHLARNDSHPLFRALGDLVVTGQTGTNVADLAIGIAAGTGNR
jgi:glycerate-2-kinase